MTVLILSKYLCDAKEYVLHVVFTQYIRDISVQKQERGNSNEFPERDYSMLSISSQRVTQRGTERSQKARRGCVCICYSVCNLIRRAPMAFQDEYLRFNINHFLLSSSLSE